MCGSVFFVDNFHIVSISIKKKSSSIRHWTVLLPMPNFITRETKKGIWASWSIVEDMNDRCFCFDMTCVFCCWFRCLCLSRSWRMSSSPRGEGRFGLSFDSKSLLMCFWQCWRMKKIDGVLDLLLKSCCKTRTTIFRYESWILTRVMRKINYVE